MSSRIPLQSSRYYLEALKQHRRTVALIIAFTITAPLFAFTSLPPIEVIEEIPQEVEEEIEIPIETNQTIEVEVNKTIEVEINITEEVIRNRTIGVNITEGGSIFLEPQPAPPLIDSDIVLCIDVSGSMDANRMPIAQTAIKTFLNLLNDSCSRGISNDRVALVTFSGTDPWDGNWANDAAIRAGLDFISNQSHLSNIISETESLVGYGWTDAWAGLNFSLDLLLNNQRETPTLKSILFLTDGKHNTGPWGIDVSNGNYTGFLSEPADFISQQEGGPYSQSPVKIARENNVKIHSIGLFEGTSYEFDENFLRNISLNETFGANGDFYTGNNTLDLSEGFLKSRDSASGWALVDSCELLIIDNQSVPLFVFNVTKDIRRIKWDLNWNDSDINFNLTIIDPNGTIRLITNSSQIMPDIITVTLDIPKSIILDFPMLGEWQFNLTCTNSSVSERILSRLSSFQPPIFIESITQYNSTELGISIYSQEKENILGNSDGITYKIVSLTENETVSNQSVIFLVNVSNRNPLFTYHNITPYVLANFTSYNITSSWNPTNISALTTGNFTIFQFNITFNEPAFLQGTIFFKVNCSEGYYDAVAQGVSLDYRITTENVTIETYTENQTITVLENQTTIVLENMTITTIIISQGTTNVLKYTYNRQVFDTLKWAGFFTTLGLLMSFLAVYVAAQAYHLRSLAKSFRSRLFPDRSAIELALQEKGISMSSEDLNAVIDSTSDLDQFAINIQNLTGQKLSPEDLIRMTSGATLEQIIHRLSYATDLTPEAIASQLKDASTIGELIEELKLDKEAFLDIITQDEQVKNFQAKIAMYIQPMKKEFSNISLNDNIDVKSFRERIKREMN
ncbi:MAG: VWA domain-containing protein [Candidatus Heimdallarchaeota archaeon]|nr:VWA domain-containing protein [Candidatus Heimdallarchaeota archaeon]